MIAYRNFVQSLLKHTDLVLDKDIQINDERVFNDVILNPSLGLGEAYMNGWWDAKDKTLDQIFYTIGRSNLSNILNNTWIAKLRLGVYWLKEKIFNSQTIEKSKLVAYQHYDLGNELYSRMLDPNMIYTCGYWKDSTNLIQSQDAKLDLICRKLNFKPGMNIIDIGCGWGGFCQYAADKYGVNVTGITISQEQFDYAVQHNKFKDRVTYKLMDYRLLLSEEYEHTCDGVVSIGMFEHVGHKNFSTFMTVVRHLLRPQGLCLLHTIGGNVSKLYGDPWVLKYIFPNSLLPTLKQITEATEKLLIIEDVHNFGSDYDKTLMSWYSNFITNFDQINHQRLLLGKPLLDDTFKRMWSYYLLSCAGMFRSRQLQLYQLVLSKGIDGGYISIR